MSCTEAWRDSFVLLRGINSAARGTSTACQLHAKKTSGAQGPRVPRASGARGRVRTCAATQARAQRAPAGVRTGSGVATSGDRGVWPPSGGAMRSRCPSECPRSTRGLRAAAPAAAVALQPRSKPHTIAVHHVQRADSLRAGGGGPLAATPHLFWGVHRPPSASNTARGPRLACGLAGSVRVLPAPGGQAEEAAARP